MTCCKGVTSLKDGLSGTVLASTSEAPIASTSVSATCLIMGSSDAKLHLRPRLDTCRQSFRQTKAVHRLGVAVVGQVRASEIGLARLVKFQSRLLNSGLGRDHAGFE